MPRSRTNKLKKKSFKSFIGEKKRTETTERCSSMNLRSKSQFKSVPFLEKQPFVCDVCFITFARKQAFKSHKNLYRSSKNYPCKICSIQFTNERHFQNHNLYVHTPQDIEHKNKLWSHICHICTQRFVRLIHKQAHMYHYHGNNLGVLDDKNITCQQSSIKHKESLAEVQTEAKKISETSKNQVTDVKKERLISNEAGTSTVKICRVKINNLKNRTFTPTKQLRASVFHQFNEYPNLLSNENLDSENENEGFLEASLNKESTENYKTNNIVDVGQNVELRGRLSDGAMTPDSTSSSKVHETLSKEININTGISELSSSEFDYKMNERDDFLQNFQKVSSESENLFNVDDCNFFSKNEKLDKNQITGVIKNKENIKMQSVSSEDRENLQVNEELDIQSTKNDMDMDKYNYTIKKIGVRKKRGRKKEEIQNTGKRVIKHASVELTSALAEVAAMFGNMQAISPENKSLDEKLKLSQHQMENINNMENNIGIIESTQRENDMQSGVNAKKDSNEAVIDARKQEENSLPKDFQIEAVNIVEEKEHDCAQNCNENVSEEPTNIAHPLNRKHSINSIHEIIQNLKRRCKSDHLEESTTCSDETRNALQLFEATEYTDETMIFHDEMKTECKSEDDKEDYDVEQNNENVKKVNVKCANTNNLLKANKKTVVDPPSSKITTSVIKKSKRNVDSMNRRKNKSTVASVISEKKKKIKEKNQLQNNFLYPRANHLKMLIERIYFFSETPREFLNNVKSILGEIPPEIVGMYDAKESSIKLREFERDMKLIKKYSCKDCYVSITRIDPRNFQRESYDKTDKMCTTISLPVYNIFCEMCSMGFKSNEAKRKHIIDNHTVVQSVICDRRLPSADAMRRHYRDDHGIGNDEDETCICGKKMDNYEALESHFFMNSLPRPVIHSGIIFKRESCKPIEKTEVCSNCGERFWLKTCLKLHRFDCKPKSTTPIPELTMDGQRRKFGEEPIQMDDLVCRFCYVEFATSEVLLKHETLYVNPVSHRCNICGTGFMGQYLLNEHVATTHANFRNIFFCYCTICNQRFSAAVNLLVHMVHIHRIECPKEVIEKRLMNNKYLKHETDDKNKTFDKKCEVCGLKFRNRERFIEHVIYYKTDETIECNICNRYFKGQYRAHCHNKTSHYAMDIRNCYVHKCTICAEGFVFRRHLKAHVFHVHDKNVDYMDVMFSNRNSYRKNQLERLETVHTCAICNVEFPSFHLLMIHQKDFENSGDFICVRCGKKCSMATSLFDHLSLNHSSTVEDNIKCHRCDENFLTPSAWISHVKHCHPSDAKEPSEFYIEMRMNSTLKFGMGNFELMPMNDDIARGFTYKMMKRKLDDHCHSSTDSPFLNNHPKELTSRNNVEIIEKKLTSDDKQIFDHDNSAKISKNLTNTPSTNSGNVLVESPMCLEEKPSESCGSRQNHKKCAQQNCSQNRQYINLLNKNRSKKIENNHPIELRVMNQDLKKKKNLVGDGHFPPNDHFFPSGTYITSTISIVNSPMAIVEQEITRVEPARMTSDLSSSNTNTTGNVTNVQYCLFQCSNCPIKFTSFENLRKHTKSIHNSTYLDKFNSYLFLQPSFRASNDNSSMTKIITLEPKKIEKEIPISTKKLMTRNKTPYSCTSQISLKMKDTMSINNTEENIDNVASTIASEKPEIRAILQCKYCNFLCDDYDLLMSHTRKNHNQQSEIFEVNFGTSALVDKEKTNEKADTGGIIPHDNHESLMSNTRKTRKQQLKILEVNSDMSALIDKTEKNQTDMIEKGNTSGIIPHDNQKIKKPRKIRKQTSILKVNYGTSALADKTETNKIDTNEKSIISGIISDDEKSQSPSVHRNLPSITSDVTMVPVTFPIQKDTQFFYKCKYCAFIFITLSVLKDHEENEHNPTDPIYEYHGCLSKKVQLNLISNVE